MQKRAWQKGLAHAGGGLLLLAIPAVALMCFSPQTLSAFASTPHPQSAAAAFSTDVATGEARVLEDWNDTALTLVQQARRQSKALNDALRAIRAQLKALDPKDPLFSFKSALIQQSLLTIAAERDAWDRTWKQIGRPGANVEQVQNQLITLQVVFVDTNSKLATMQAQEVQQGSVFSFTPPSF